MNTPTVGSPLFVKLASPSNGTDIAPAIVTQAFEPSGRVNVIAFPDNAAPVSMTSLEVVDVLDPTKAAPYAARLLVAPIPRGSARFRITSPAQVVQAPAAAAAGAAPPAHPRFRGG